MNEFTDPGIVPERKMPGQPQPNPQPVSKRPSFYPMEFPNNTNSTIEIPGRHRETEYRNIVDVVVNEIEPQTATQTIPEQNSSGSMQG